jgi:heme-degrading protein
VDTPPPFFDEPLNVGRYSMLKMPHIYPVEGGIPVIVDGQWVGAIGVASVLPHLDAAVADAGRKALDRSDLAMAPTGRLTGVSYSKDLKG